MQYPSSSYANNPQTSLRDPRGKFPENVHGPYKVARSEVNGQSFVFDELVSEYETKTGKKVVYAIRDVGADAMHCLQLSPEVKDKLAECFSPYSGNVTEHIVASKGESDLLLRRECNSILGNRDPLVQALREGARRCDSVAQATDIILREHYGNQSEPKCDRIERVGSRKMAHTFVRVILRDGSTVIHDHWINPEAFLQEDGRFSMADDLEVVATWRPGDPITRRWEDLKQQAKAAGEIRIEEFPPLVQSRIHAGEYSGDLVTYVKRMIGFGGYLDRTESDCLLTPEQAAQRGMQPNVKIAYRHGRDYYSSDVVARSSIRRVRDPSFPGPHLRQAQWELDVEAAFVGRDLEGLTQLLKRGEAREWFPERHGNLCLRAMGAALNMPLDAQNMAFIGVLFKHAIDAVTATQIQLMLRQRVIDDALRNRDADALEAWLSPETVAAIGDHGSRWLMVACQELNPHGVKSLLRAGAQFHAPHGLENGLSLAIEAGGTDMVKLLIKQGASALRPNALGVIPWQFALQLLRDLPATGVDQERRQAVAGSVYDYAVAEALALRPADRALLEALRASIGDGAQRNALTLAIWRSDLEQACSSGNVKEISLLLASEFVKADRAMRKKANIAASALLCRVVESAPVDPAVVDALLAGGMDINQRGKDGKTPLLAACSRAEVGIVSKLLDAGATLDDSSWDGYSALGHACRRGSPDLVRLLLERGASPKSKDHMGYSAEDLAREFRELCPTNDPAYAGRAEVLSLFEQSAG
ncbi:ankyrin repeat domain-containing protein [Rhizobacter sp. P5_C2]